MEPQLHSGIAAWEPELRVLKARPLFPVALYLMAGIASVQFLPVSAAAGFLLFAAGLMACAFLFALKKNITVPLMLLAVVSGYALASAAIPAWASDSAAPEGKVSVRGTVADVQTTRSGFKNYTLSDVSLNGQSLAGGVLLTVRGAAGGQPGDVLTATAELSRPEVSQYEGDFNYRGYTLRRGIRYVGFAAGVKTAPSGRSALLSLPYQARAYAERTLNTYLDSQSAGLVAALLSGDKSGIDADTKADFIRLGVAHLLAVSGLNISLTAGAAWLLCRKLKLPRLVGLILSCLVMAAYVLFAGLTPSVERAAVMWLVMMAGIVFARQYDPLSSLSAAAILTLALNPLDLFDTGFQLSFAATAAIVLWVAPLMRLAPQNRALKWFAGAVGVTVCVTLLALPIIARSFHSVSLLSPLANLVLVPLSLVLQLAGTALLFVGPWPAVATALGHAIDWVAGFYLQSVSRLVWSSVSLAAAVPPLWLAGAYVLPVLAVSPAVLRWGRGGRVVSIVALFAMAALLVNPLSAALAGPVDAVVNEGGNSLSVCWQVNGRVYAACDGGYAGLAAYLESRGVTTVEGLYVFGAKPPKSGAVLAANRDIHVRTLYVPQQWLADPNAGAFLQQAALLGIATRAAESGPFELISGGQGEWALLAPMAGGRLSYIPTPWAAAPASASALSTADAVVIGGKPAKASAMLGGATPGNLVLAGAVAGGSAAGYNGAEAGSIRIEQSGGGLALLPWITGWADGLQGNFR